MEQLPPHDLFIQNFDPSFVNWLPFYWNNYEQTTKYTYVLHDIKNLETVYSHFRSNVKRNIKKAKKIVKVHTDEGFATFYELYQKTFARQGMTPPHSMDFLTRLDSICQQKGCREIFFAVDELDQVHAAVYIVWDQESAYYLMGGADTSLRNSGAMSLLLWEAIQFSSTVVDKFDFEGSMIEPIERFFRSFGSVQTPYYQI